MHAFDQKPDLARVPIVSVSFVEQSGLVCVLFFMIFTLLGVGPAQSQQGPPASASPEQELGGLFAMERVVQEAIDRASPSVVAIARVSREGARDVASELNFNFPGLQPIGLGAAEWLPLGGVVTEYGSGVIVDTNGQILTCYHLLDDPDKHDYFVWLSRSDQADPQTLGAQEPQGSLTMRGNPPAPRQAKVLAGDPWSDLAVLQIEGENLPAISFGDATAMKQGAFVLALGNPYAAIVDGRASASWGLVSNLQRRAPSLRAGERESRGVDRDGRGEPVSLLEYPTLIQTDAKLSLGTSGGALINLRGEMIGLTTSIAAVAGFEQAAGYAIAMDPPTAEIIRQLREGRSPAFGFLGVEPMDAEGRGALVRNVVPGLSGDNAGIRAGDMIVEVEGRRITSAIDLFLEMSRRPADSKVRLKLLGPGGQGREVSVVLGKKRLALLKPSYSLVEEPQWRGLAVDFASVLPPDRLLDPRGVRQGVRQATAAAVIRVDPDSPAWLAGIRPGRIIVRVGETPIERPEDFFESVKDLSGPATLWLQGSGGGVEAYDVAPESPDSTDPVGAAGDERQ